MRHGRLFRGDLTTFGSRRHVNIDTFIGGRATTANVLSPFMSPCARQLPVSGVLPSRGTASSLWSGAASSWSDVQKPLHFKGSKFQNFPALHSRVNCARYVLFNNRFVILKLTTLESTYRFLRIDSFHALRTSETTVVMMCCCR